jgi:hypothetical protein
MLRASSLNWFYQVAPLRTPTAELRIHPGKAPASAGRAISLPTAVETIRLVSLAVVTQIARW